MKKKIKKVKVKEPVILDVNQMHLSFSGTDTYLKCGKQYEFRYISGIKSPPGVALIEGSSHHKALEQNNLQKKDQGRDMSYSNLTDIFMTDFRTRVKAEENVQWGGETEDNIFSRAKILHEKYINQVAPNIHPIEIEKKFEIPLEVEKGNTIIIKGVCDLEQVENLLDYKTAARSKGQAEVDNSLQLSLYSYATKKREVGIIELIKKANPEIGMITSRRDATQVLWALEVVKSVAKAIQAKVFPLAPPTSWACSERFCGYWGMCRGKR